MVDTDTNEIVPIDQLSAAIKNGGVSVDDEAVQGAYNLVFNERRLKAEVQLLASEQDFNEGLSNALFNAERLNMNYDEDDDTNFDVPYEIKLATMFSKKKALESFTHEWFWGEDAIAGQDGYVPVVGKFIPYSWNMVRFIYASLMALSSKLTPNPEYEFKDWPHEANSRTYVSFSYNGTEFKQLNPEYKRMFDAKKPKYVFWNSFYNIVNFLMRGLEIKYNSGNYVAASNNVSKFNQYGNFFKSYLNDICSGLGDGFNDFLGVSDNWSMNVVKASCPNTYYHPSVPNSADFKHPGVLFYGAKIFNNSGETNGICYLTPVWRMFDLYLCTVSIESKSNSWQKMLFTDKQGENEYYYHELTTDASEWQLRIAMFLSCILKYSWQQSELARFAASGFQRASLPISQLYTNSCLFHQNCHILRGTNFNHTAQFAGGTFINHAGGLINCDYNLYYMFRTNTTIKCLANRIYNNTPDENVYFGSVQVKTVEENQDKKNLVFIPHENPYPEDNIFQPVHRLYKVFNEEEVAIYSDNIDMQILFINNWQNFLLAPCMYQETNWIYFDYVEIKEYGCNYNIPSQVYFDPIPIFDVDEDMQPDGSYVYAENFNKYFTQAPSKLTNIVVTLTDDNNIIYRGLIDITSVSKSKKSISFTATDYIGLLAENIKALDGCIAWAQYSRNLSSDVALPYCGTTINAFIKFLLRGGVFGMFHTTIYPDFTKNKLLKDISTNDAFIIAIQCLKKLVVCNYQNNSIEFVDIDKDSAPIEILSEQIIDKKLTIVDNYCERFNPELLKNLAGFEKIISDVMAFYNGLFTNKNMAIELELLSEGLTQIKTLDKIRIDSIVCIVMSVSRNLKRKTITINGVRVE